MRNLIIAAGCLALAAAITADTVNAQGPVRRGLRATGQAAGRVVEGGANVVGGVGQGAANIAGGVAQGAANVAGGVAQGAADVTRGVVGGAARGVAAGVDALTPGIPLQARAGANLQAADQARDARWRFQRHNGEWWYYTPQNAWMYHRDGQWNAFAADSFAPNQQFAGQYSSAYRGPDGAMQGDPQYGGQQFAGDQYQAQGQVHQLRRDQYGREFICHNGRRVYVDQGQGGQPHQVGYGQGDMTGAPGQPTPTPALPESPAAGAAGQPGAEGQGAAGVTTETSAIDASTTPQAGAGTTTPAAPRVFNNQPSNSPQIGVPTAGQGSQQ